MRSSIPFLRQDKSYWQSKEMVFKMLPAVRLPRGSSYLLRPQQTRYSSIAQGLLELQRQGGQKLKQLCLIPWSLANILTVLVRSFLQRMQQQWMEGLLLITYIRMINQSTINSFISLIAKNHSHKKQHLYAQLRKNHNQTDPPTLEIFNHSTFQQQHQCYLQQLPIQQSPHTLQQNFKDKILALINQSNKKKDRLTNNLYNLYRHSIDKQKNTLANHPKQVSLSQTKDQNSPNQVKKGSLRHHKEINFPISRPNRIKQTSFKIMRKRQITTPYPSINCRRTESYNKIKTQPASDNRDILQVGLKQIFKADIDEKTKKNKRSFFRAKRFSQHNESQGLLIGSNQPNKKQNQMQGKSYRMKSKALCYLKGPTFIKSFEERLKIDVIEPWHSQQKEDILIQSDI